MLSNLVKYRGCVLTAAVLATVLAPRAASGQSPVTAADTLRLSLLEARQRAIRANPELRAARLDVDIGRAQLRQASNLFNTNPAIDFLGRGSTGNGLEIGIGQEIEVFGQRGARRAAARAGITGATASVTNSARTLLGEVERTFFRLLVADRRHALALEVLALNTRLGDIARRQLDLGEISRLQFNLTAVELGRARARVLAARREREQANLDLARLTGLPSTVMVAPLHSPPSDSAAAAAGELPPIGAPVTLNTDSLTAVALAQRPDIAVRVAAAQQARAQATLAGRERLPNLSFRAVREDLSSGTGQGWRPGVGFTVPLFNRSGGLVAGFRARELQAGLERDALVAGVRVSVVRAVRQYETATAEASLLETAVLPSARENSRLLETAYREGKVGLPEVLIIRNQAVEAELEYAAAWLAAHQALADLAETTGGNLPPNAIVETR